MIKTGTVDVNALINQSPISRYQMLILFLCFTIVALDGFDTGSIGYIAPSLVAAWGVSKPALTPVLSAALFGLAAGALTAGPLADRFGRKGVLILSVALYGGFSLSTAFAHDVEDLTVLRFLTGLGLGAAMPNAVTLMSEYCPTRRRAIIVNTMFCGFPLGISLGGLVAAWLIPNFGWRSVLVVGGVAPLALALALIPFLPESIMYLVVRKGAVDRIRRALSRIVTADLAGVEHFVASEKQASGRNAAQLILSKPYIVGSTMLWLTYFMGLVIFYLVMMWLPLLMKESGFTTQGASLFAAMFPLGGGIGTIFSGWLMDKVVPHKVIAAAYTLTGILLFAVGQAVGLPVMLATMIFLAGTAMNGAQSSMPALAAAYYPTSARATGVAWMLGIGRFGAIAGTLVGGQLMSMQLSFSSIFTLLVVPSFVSAAALAVKYLVARHDEPVAEPIQALGH